MCPKSFTRSEHRIRHERSHTLEKPFSCRYCRRKYARRDLVLRHEKTIHKDEYIKGASPIRKNASSAIDSAQRTDDVEGSPSTSSLEATSPPQPVSLNGSHRRISIAPAVAFPTPQPCLDAFLNDDLTSSFDAQNDQRKAPQQISPDSSMSAEKYDMLEKALQTAGLDCSEPESVLPGSGLSEGQDEAEPYWPLLDISLPFDVGSGFEFPLESRSPRILFNLNNTGQEAPAFLRGLPPPPVNVHPDPLHAGIPTVVIRDRPRTKAVMFTQDMRQNIISDLLDIGLDADIGTAVPSATVMQNCMRGYFDRFHIHHALFHPHKFTLDRMASPLILAMCAIGALYRLDRKLSASLFCMAERALDMLSLKRDGEAASPSFEAKATSSSTRQTMSSPKPLWELQTRVLLVFVAAIGGQAAFSRKAIDGIGFLACEYRILASYLCRDSWQAYVSWNHWIGRESKKRVLHAILAISDILNITFRVSPIISLVQEYDVDLPDDDELWHASTELDWMLIVQARTRGPLPTLRSAVSQLLYGGSPETGPVLDQWSPCAVAVVMHAVSIHTWNLMQSAQTLTGFGLNLHPPGGIQALLVSNIETALSRCYLMISNARAANEVTWDEAEGPLLFNSLSLLRGIHARVLTGVGGLDRMALLSDVEEDMTAAVKDFVTQNSKRHAVSAKTARVIFDGIMTILRSDAFLLRKTAAFNWSIEHALVGIDCAIYLSNCIQKIQLNQKQHEETNSAELEFLKMATDLLVEMEHVSNEQESLAAGVLRMWKNFYDDVWVWGVTPRIARLFEQLACAYDLQLASLGDTD
ncbi:hypothetical protein N7517_000168 [Penicillium concentricum]|uniref:C2H2-type domain-containing protein n=1 Tax=Penicillium concentricum TaxID=293559 RepID=A0A9W9VHM3_9EURO|nr:uncharacterized protein N7517_000168 [Penicillium concentricum]KAJ5382257.1 hypothetical protein N7517_000168 [Penicillium concentricum]